MFQRFLGFGYAFSVDFSLMELFLAEFLRVKYAARLVWPSLYTKSKHTWKELEGSRMLPEPTRTFTLLLSRTNMGQNIRKPRGYASFYCSIPFIPSMGFLWILATAPHRLRRTSLRTGNKTTTTNCHSRLVFSYSYFVFVIVNNNAQTQTK